MIRSGGSGQPGGVVATDLRIVRSGPCPTCGHDEHWARALYRELTDSQMTWVDAVTWLTAGALVGGLVVWGVR